MDELEKVLENTLQPLVEQTQPDQQVETSDGVPVEQAQAQAPEALEPAPNQSPSNQHFKAVKQLKERAERERDEALSQLRAMQSKSSEPDTEFNLGNDELAEGKHLKAVVNEVKKLKNELKQYQQQSVSSLVSTRLKMEYPDIEKVVTKENIEVLAAQYPELASTLSSSTDLYNQGVSAYTLIKKLGIMPEDNFQNDRIRTQLNANKPRPLTSISPQQGDSPLSHANAFANGLTDELKSQLYKEMIEARR
jgi:hypothetical protein